MSVLMWLLHEKRSRLRVYFLEARISSTECSRDYRLIFFGRVLAIHDAVLRMHESIRKKAILTLDTILTPKTIAILRTSCTVHAVVEIVRVRALVGVVDIF